MASQFDAPEIVDLRILLIELPLEKPRLGAFGTRYSRNNLIVEIVTDAGIGGIGEVWSAYPAWGCGERIDILRHAVRPQLVGERLDDPARLFAKLRGGLQLLANQWGAPGPVHQSIAGTDIALWDAYARHLELPLKDAVKGAAAPDRVPVYGSSISGDAPVEVIAAARENGHRRFKLRLTFGEEVDRRALKAARREAGDAPLMADANQTWSPETLQALSGDVMAAGLRWIEEPFPVNDRAAYDGWPYVDDLPLAMGENAYGLDGIAALMTDWNPDIVQPDITKTAGITEGRVIARNVVGAGRRLCLHMAGGPIGQFASGHLAAATDGADWVEMDCNPNPLFDTVCDHSPTVEDGDMVLPPGPGLGVTLSDQARRLAKDVSDQGRD